MKKKKIFLYYLSIYDLFYVSSVYCPHSEDIVVKLGVFQCLPLRTTELSIDIIEVYTRKRYQTVYLRKCTFVASDRF